MTENTGQVLKVKEIGKMQSCSMASITELKFLIYYLDLAFYFPDNIVLYVLFHKNIIISVLYINRSEMEEDIN